MNTTTEFNHLADAVKATVVPKSFRSLTGFSAAKALCVTIDNSLQSKNLSSAGKRESALIDLSILLRGAVMDNQALGDSNAYVSALSEFAYAVDAAYASIKHDQAHEQALRHIRLRDTALETAAKERESRLREPVVDVAARWKESKALVSKEHLRSLSRFQAASAAVEAIEALISKYPEALAGGEGEHQSIERFLEELWKIPKVGSTSGMGDDLAAHDVYQGISSAALDRLAQIRYEIDSRPENVLRSWNTPTAK